MDPADTSRDATDRACVGVAVPPGPAGVAALMPALEAALAGCGPAVAPYPGAGSPSYVERIRAAVRPGEPVTPGIATVVATSGSTGDPAGVLLGADALRAAAAGFAERSGAPEGHQWVAALPLHHAGGLMVAVRSAAAGTVPVATSSLGGAEPFSVPGFARATAQALVRGRADGRPLAVSLVPAMLAALDDAAAQGRDLLAEYDAVVVGGASAPMALLDRLRAAGVHVVTSYGMTETCGGAVFDGRALPGTRASADPEGRLVLCGAQVGSGYRDGRHPQRWSTGSDGTRCFRTGDLGEVRPDGTVLVRGRSDDQVQVGGASVALGAVRASLHCDPRVAAAEVVAVPDPRWGARIVAFVVPATAGRDLDPTVLVDSLAAAVQADLGSPARPRPVHLVPALPLGPAGKVDLGALAVRAGLLPAEGPR